MNISDIAWGLLIFGVLIGLVLLGEYIAPTPCSPAAEGFCP